MTRRFWIAVIVLAVAAALTSWLVWLRRERDLPPRYVGPPRSDYTLTDFTLQALDSSGKPAFHMAGPALARRGEDGAIFITAPQYILHDGSGGVWTGTSDSARVDQEGEVMTLQGRVRMHRAAQGDMLPIDVDTHDLVTRPRQKTMETREPATIVQGGSILRGTGMRGDLAAKTLELLSDVHSTLQPHSRSAPP